MRRLAARVSLRAIPVSAATSALALALIALLLLWQALPAFAAEDDENLVDPTQRADNSFIYDTTIESLFEQSSLYDGRTVQIVGEVIGDRIKADRDGAYCWITLTVLDVEDKTTISVYMSEDQANQIDHYGKYGVTGTVLQVRGTYNAGCIEHAGLPDIHATSTSVMSKGVEHPDVFNMSDFAPGIVAVLVGFTLMGLFYLARERLR